MSTKSVKDLSDTNIIEEAPKFVRDCLLSLASSARRRFPGNMAIHLDLLKEFKTPDLYYVHPGSNEAISNLATRLGQLEQFLQTTLDCKSHRCSDLYVRSQPGGPIVFFWSTFDCCLLPLYFPAAYTIKKAIDDFVLTSQGVVVVAKAQ